jgi:RNA polymerase sigma-70 factor (ECF subfamily)
MEKAQARQAEHPGEASLGDEVLLRRSGSGDRAAFDLLVTRHGDALYRFALRQCRTARDAEDATQEGLLAAWRGAPSWRGEAAPRTWLFQVVLHACRRHGRRRAGEPERHDGLDQAVALAGEGQAPDERVATRQAGEALRRVLAGLSEEAREVLLLRDVEGLPGEEAAAVLGLGLAAMKSRLHRARLELKAGVEALLGGAIAEDGT